MIPIQQVIADDLTNIEKIMQVLFLKYSIHYTGTGFLVSNNVNVYTNGSLIYLINKVLTVEAEKSHKKAKIINDGELIRAIKKLLANED